ncbi:hypothetical protein ACE1OC_43280 (plasmid) [Streptomyces sp. DSM 116496]|uniref:hypothetical protein n=1 Tax=Streptomyces stoeckheimensis TaxID=3344656 RepID=UPI0038B25566
MSTTVNGQQQPTGDNSDAAFVTIRPTLPSKRVTVCAVLGGTVVAGATTLIVKIYPTWADPLQVGIAASGLYLLLAGLLWRWYRHRR